MVSQVVDYFIAHGSSVYLASLDASKAFDRVHYVKLFNKLVAKGLHGHIIKILMDWYGKIYSVVRWNNTLSRQESVKSGIRQGGILFPFLFNIYMDSLINRLRKADLCCHIGGVFVGVVAYADDLGLLLVSASVVQLQRMLNICYSQAEKVDIQFNAKKIMSNEVW